jgi:leader peptidase (prepilin peptidase)/N-methyltransferase
MPVPLLATTPLHATNLHVTASLAAALRAAALHTAAGLGPAALLITFAARSALVLWCVVLSVIDLRERRLPNVLTATGAAGVLGFAAATGRGGAAITGALLLALPYLACHLLAPAAFGAGDVKLAVGLGGAAACGGAQAWVWAAITAPILTALLGGAYLVHRHIVMHRPGPNARASPGDSAVPHGPAMCLSTLAALLDPVNVPGT